MRIRMDLRYFGKLDSDPRLSEKSWIRIRIKVKIQELSRLNMEPWMAEGTHNGCVEAQNGALEGP
jgi:hypothetical protein